MVPRVASPIWTDQSEPAKVTVAEGMEAPSASKYHLYKYEVVNHDWQAGECDSKHSRDTGCMMLFLRGLCSMPWSPASPGLSASSHNQGLFVGQSGRRLPATNRAWDQGRLVPRAVVLASVLGRRRCAPHSTHGPWNSTGVPGPRNFWHSSLDQSHKAANIGLARRLIPRVSDIEYHLLEAARPQA